jgi:hypothetical protein
MEYSGGEPCLTIVPHHPVFNHDATRLFLVWQRYFAKKYLSVKKDLMKEDLAAEILNKRPPVIVYRIDDRLVSIDLLLNGWISKENYRKILQLLEEEYEVRKIGNEKFYIRKDRL